MSKVRTPEAAAALIGDAATVAVSASSGLCCPDAVLEAIGAQVPIIATRVGGIPEIFEDERDCLIEPGDADALATALLVMGPDDGMQLATRENLAVLFLVRTDEG